MNSFLKCVVFVLMQILVLQIGAKEDDLIVRIKNGLVLGSRDVTVDMHKVYYSFRGIPYAEPPLGDLRFSSPIPSKNWTGILNATMEGNICTQHLDEGSEDCLFLNVYTTHLDELQSLPVMVWIYGGYFLEGSSRYSDYGPDYFLDQDVVIVTLNYRLGVFGFLSTQDEFASGNWGLKDQILALTWVQENIEYFGGNPRRVIVFGESAGSASVSYLLQANLTRDLFHGAIMESGTSLNLWSLSRHPRATAFHVGRSLGILTDDAAVLIKQLKQVDYRKLQVASIAIDLEETVLTNPRNGLIFAPCEETNYNSSVVVNKSHQKLMNGEFSRVPIIIGFNSKEALVFTETLNVVRAYLLTYDLFPTRLIPIDMNINPEDQLVVALDIKNHYFGVGLVALSDNNLIQYVTDDQFARPINEAVRLMSNYTTVYYYRLSYMGRLGLNAGHPKRSTLGSVGDCGAAILHYIIQVDSHKCSFSYKVYEYSGVGHEEDLNYLWRRSTNIRNPSKCDLVTRRRMIKLWTNFAKTLNPTSLPDSELQDVIWTPATPQAQYYLDINKNLTVNNNLSLYSIEWWRKLYSEYGHPPYDTY